MTGREFAQNGNGTAPTLVDSRGRGVRPRERLVEQCLELDRGESTEGVLAASAVVGGLDPGDDRQAELVAGGPAAAVEDVLLQQAEERLHGGVVGAGPDPAHRPAQPVPRAGSGRRRGTGTGCRGRSARRSPTGSRRAMALRSASTASCGGHAGVDGVADDPVGAGVLDRAEVELALGGGVLGDVGQPQLVRAGRR